MPRYHNECPAEKYKYPIALEGSENMFEVFICLFSSVLASILSLRMRITVITVFCLVQQCSAGSCEC